MQDELKITIIYDNTVYPVRKKPFSSQTSKLSNRVNQKGLKADWGFSCLVEIGHRQILFDTGAHGFIFLDNIKKLNIDPSLIKEVFISHSHWDHTGGLADFLNINKDVKIYIPNSYSCPFERKQIVSEKPLQIAENIFSTGELNRIEQSLIVKTKKGLVVIVGCSHPGLENIIKAASQFGKPYTIIGGLHGFNNFNLVKDLELICPTHCTQFKAEIKSLYPKKYIEGGAGKVIEV